MNKTNYQKALETREWRNKRAEILKRDKYACKKCDSVENLHIHHIWYISGNMPWEVPNKYLITLCNLCHAKEHEGRTISSFVKNNPDKSKTVKTSSYIKKSKKSIKEDRLKRLMMRSVFTAEEKVLLKNKKLKVHPDLFHDFLFNIPEFDAYRERLKQKLTTVKSKTYDPLREILN